MFVENDLKNFLRKMIIWLLKKDDKIYRYNINGKSFIFVWFQCQKRIMELLNVKPVTSQVDKTTIINSIINTINEILKDMENVKVIEYDVKRKDENSIKKIVILILIKYYYSSHNYYYTTNEKGRKIKISDIFKGNIIIKNNKIRLHVDNKIRLVLYMLKSELENYNDLIYKYILERFLKNIYTIKIGSKEYIFFFYNNSCLLNLLKNREIIYKKMKNIFKEDKLKAIKALKNVVEEILSDIDNEKNKRNRGLTYNLNRSNDLKKIIILYMIKFFIKNSDIDFNFIENNTIDFKIFKNRDSDIIFINISDKIVHFLKKFTNIIKEYHKEFNVVEVFI